MCGDIDIVHGWSPKLPRMALWILYALAAAVFAALVAILGKLGISGIDTTAATAVRAVVMAIFLVGAALVLGKTHAAFSIGRRPLLFIVGSGLAGALSWLFYFLALKHGPAVGVSALDRLSVVLVFLLALVFLDQAFTWRAALGAVLVVAGTILLT